MANINPTDMKENCIFCKIIHGEATTHLIYQDESISAFKDTRPITPVHILIVPNRHINSLNEIGIEDEPLFGHILKVAQELAGIYGLLDSGYRIVINTGPDAGQSVFHFYLHLLGGRRMPFHFELC